MAEGWARHLRSKDYEPYSAGIEKHGLNPLAVRVGRGKVDIRQRSKLLSELTMSVRLGDHGLRGRP
jgi:arsenate reductase